MRSHLPLDRIDAIGMLRRCLQTTAFCLAVSAIQYAFQPEKAYDILVRYSLCIGLLTWATIDFGRYLFKSHENTGWPSGIGGVALPACGIVLGYLGGTALADWWCGLSSWGNGQAQWRISVGITLLAGTAAIYYFYTHGKSAWLHARMNEVRSQATQAQLKLLQTQLEPHMLFNTLANLRVLIGTDPERAQAMLDRMIDYLRATLSASRSTEHPLADEFERLRDYLELMAVRMGTRLTYTLDLPDALRDAPIPPLLLQPLVENAIRHGLEPQVQGGHITVSARTQNSSPAGSAAPLLVIEVNDTGVGLADSPMALPSAGHGFGLTQVRERLATLYGSTGTLDLIAASAGGISARVSFPLKSSAHP